MNREKQILKIKNKLKDLANNTGSPYQAILTEFLIERIVFRLMKDPVLEKHLVFKGGYVGLKCFDSPRYTVDLDAIAYNINNSEVIARAKKAISQDIMDGVWFSLDKEIDLLAQNEYGGTCLQYRSGIGDLPENIKRSQIIKVDIGTGDPVTPSPVINILNDIFGESSISWQVYTIETIVAEKLHCLISRGSDNSRSKDIYDLALYLDKCDKKVLNAAINATFLYRGDVVPEKIYQIFSEIEKDLLKRGWKSATGLLKDKPEFDNTFNKIRDWFEKVKL